MTLQLTIDLLNQIYAHADDGYPEEVCGLILGPRGTPDEIRRCHNRQNALHAEDPLAFPRDARTAYNLGAEDLFFLDASLRSDRPTQVIYHSHIDVGAYFSKEDELAAAAGELLYPVDYLVIDARPEGARGARLFHFHDGRFIELATYHRGNRR